MRVGLGMDKDKDKDRDGNGNEDGDGHRHGHGHGRQPLLTEAFELELPGVERMAERLFGRAGHTASGKKKKVSLFMPAFQETDSCASCNRQHHAGWIPFF